MEVAKFLLYRKRVLGILPRNTLDWRKFIIPGEHIPYLLLLQASLDLLPLPSSPWDRLSSLAFAGCMDVVKFLLLSIPY